MMSFTPNGIEASAPLPAACSGATCTHASTRASSSGIRSTAGASARSRASRDTCCQSRNVSSRVGPAARRAVSAGAVTHAATVVRNVRRLMCLLSRVILPLDVLLDVGAVEPDVAQIAGRVSLSLIAKVLGLRVAAPAPGGDRPGADAVAELDDGDEAVAGGAVHFLCAAERARAERGERSPAGGRERHRNAR